MIFSAIAMMVMGVMDTTTTLNEEAFDLGLISKDINVGSIDTKSLFNCFGAAITYDNENTVNNNISVNNGTSQPNPSTCEECLADALTTQQIANLAGFLGLPTSATLTEICLALQYQHTTANFINFASSAIPIGLGLTINAATDLAACIGLE